MVSVKQNMEDLVVLTGGYVGDLNVTPSGTPSSSVLIKKGRHLSITTIPSSGNWTPTMMTASIRRKNMPLRHVKIHVQEVGDLFLCIY